MSYKSGFLIFLSVFALGESRTTPFVPGLDTTLLKGKTPAEFFADRAKNSDCREELEGTRKAYQSLTRELKDLVAKGASASEIESKEWESRRARSTFLKVIGRCGECATQPMTYQKVEKLGGNPEHWYTTDGSCYIGNLENAAKRFEAAKKILMHTKNYARQNGGFYSILECFGVNKATGEKLPLQEMTPFPYYAFMAVKGPLGQSFNYMIDVSMQNTNINGIKGWAITFTGSKAPLKFQNDVYEVMASGRKKKTTPYSLSNVYGMWYITEDGYFRYGTKADFLAPFGTILSPFAIETLTDTIMQMVESTGDAS